MKLVERAVGEVVVLTVTGDVSLNGQGDTQLREKVADFLKEGHRKLVLDLGGVTYMDSAGLGQLVYAQTSTKGAGATLKVANPTVRLRQLLAVSKITSLFDIHDSETAALASFGVTEAPSPGAGST